jgi:anthranilate phosphoribosyltransferase
VTGPDSGGGTSEVPGGWPAIFARLVAGEDLDAEQARFALGDVLEGSAGEARLAGLLVGLAAKGPSPTELEAMVDAMLDAAVPLVLSDPHSTTDIVGTGGSPRRREAALNVSTMAAFVAAGAGAVVCKHGNRRASSTSGSFDLLDELGVTVELDADGVRRCVDEAGIGFAFARVFHPAMRHAAPVRTALGVPTLAPLVIDVLSRRGSPRAMVVCGHDGTDEIVTTGTTRIHELRDGEVRVYDFDPASVGIAVVEAAQVQGGDPVRNATIARQLFAGAGGPVADMVALNAAAVLVVAGRADSIADGLELARAALADGAASRRLETLVALLNP